MLVAADGDPLLSTSDKLQQFGHPLAHRLWIGPAVQLFQFAAPPLLVGGHASLAPQGAVCMEQEEPRIDLHGHIVVKRMVLAEFEGLEAIDGYSSSGRDTLDHLCMKE